MVPAPYGVTNGNISAVKGTNPFRSVNYPSPSSVFHTSTKSRRVFPLPVKLPEDTGDSRLTSTNVPPEHTSGWENTQKSTCLDVKDGTVPLLADELPDSSGRATTVQSTNTLDHPSKPPTDELTDNGQEPAGDSRLTSTAVSSSTSSVSKESGTLAGYALFYVFFMLLLATQIGFLEPVATGCIFCGLLGLKLLVSLFSSGTKKTPISRAPSFLLKIEARR